MGAAVVLQAEGALEAVASCRHDRSESTKVLGGSGRSQTLLSLFNSRIWKMGAAVDFSSLFLSMALSGVWLWQVDSWEAGEGGDG